MSYKPRAAQRDDRYRVHVEQFRSFQRDGYLLAKGLVNPADVERIRDWADNVLYGREKVPGIDPAQESATLEELLARFTRIHMLHRVLPTAEWGLLHPRVLDVLEALIGPDVLALQSMLFFNPPGRGGQGWHQDSYYITTYPDTLIGAWMPLEPADEENGCLWVVPGSNHEPIYPPRNAPAHVHAAGAFEGMKEVENVSHLDDEVNGLTDIVEKYPPMISVPMEPGDVLFFGGHVLHRSFPNRTNDRFRRAYVCHYCNARSWVPWNHGAPFEGDAANQHHILARGWTHLPFSKPRFGTEVHLSLPDPDDKTPGRMMGDEDGMMGMEGDDMAVAGISAHLDTPVG
ncbi:MAG: phytanoyl-CoA dioxygenase family protein [Armatimonadetes bacterium]|nr:phytanoyl-CoA dioxygenase family protein [Armatimonadota bacterium]